MSPSLFITIIHCHFVSVHPPERRLHEGLGFPQDHLLPLPGAGFGLVLEENPAAVQTAASGRVLHHGTGGLAHLAQWWVDICIKLLTD